MAEANSWEPKDTPEVTSVIATFFVPKSMKRLQDGSIRLCSALSDKLFGINVTDRIRSFTQEATIRDITTHPNSGYLYWLGHDNCIRFIEDLPFLTHCTPDTTAVVVGPDYQILLQCEGHSAGPLVNECCLISGLLGYNGLNEEVSISKVRRRSSAGSHEICVYDGVGSNTSGSIKNSESFGQLVSTKFQSDSFKGDMQCFAFNKSGDVFIGLREKPEVIILDSDGSIKGAIDCVSSPVHIAVCRKTGKVAISCGTSGVMVLNSSCQTLFTYNPVGRSFFASDADFDDYGHILILNKSDSNIHVVDCATGSVEKIITFGDEILCCLETLPQGEVLTGTDDGIELNSKLISMTYLQQKMEC